MKQTQRSTFKLLFYLKKNAPKKDGTIPIMARITIDGKIAQFSTKLSVDLNKWDLKYGRVIGRNNEAKSINQKLDTIRVRVNHCYNDSILKYGFASSQKVKNAFLGIGIESEAILPFFKEHNEQIEVKSIHTYTRAYKHLKNFILLKYNNKDFRFRELNDDFANEFEKYLRYNVKISHNTIWLYMYAFFKVLKLAIKKEIIPKNPFLDYKIVYKEVDRAFLTKDELQRFTAVVPKNKSEELIKDLFVFSCFTGLAFIDVKKLKKSELQTFLDGSLWIIKRRQKTTSSSNLRVLDIPMKIIEKYKDFSNEFVFPSFSNVTTNKYLKSLQQKAQINKRITFHIARHTFATLFLSENVPLESVSKMMGHKNLTTTLIYAKITNKKISKDLDRFETQIKPFEQKILSEINQV
ncbi:MAG: site-specific integrase [Flavobacteriaceae bacterium]|nr:site-specific integrase [Flavobacteriaceae bacterium]